VTEPETIDQAARRLVRRQRAEQGLPPEIEDPAALGWLASRLRDAEATLDLSQRAYRARARLAETA
jgi:hypothetical protein